MEQNIEKLVEEAYCKVDYNLVKRATIAKYTSDSESLELLSLYVLVYAVDKLRRFAGTSAYDNLFFKLRRIT